MRQPTKEEQRVMDNHLKHKMIEEKELKQIEKEIQKVSKSIYTEIKKELYRLNEKAGTWDYDELVKYDRLNKTQRNIEKIISEGKKKELTLIMAFLVSRGIKTEKSIIDLTVTDGKIKPIEKAEIRGMIDRPWSGMPFKERHKKNADYLGSKVKERVNLTAITAGASLALALRGIEGEVGKATKNSKRLTITENSHINYEVTTQTMVKIKAKLIYNAVLDTGTCDSCGSMHGEVHEVGDEPMLPQHDNCRCFYTPFVE